MLAVYRSWCQEEGLQSVSRKVFSQILKDKKIGIHHPRKDQCKLCVSYKEGNLEKETYDEHVAKKK